MNRKSLGEVTLALPVSEFLDRYLISHLKLNKFKQAGKTDTEQLQKWIDHHQRDYTNIIDFSENVRQASDELAKVHEQLWDLEDLVRSPKATELEYFAKTARKIFSLNTDRHKLKHKIDIELPSLSFGPRLYDKGVE